MPDDKRPPPHEIVNEMLRGAWVCQTISAVTRLDVPDLLAQHGPLSARELTEQHGVEAETEPLERALRALAGVGVVTESADGRFGSTPLSDVLTSDARGSLKQLASLFGTTWWDTWGGLREALRTGRPQTKTELWDYKSDPEEMERFAAAMKARRTSRRLVEHSAWSRARRVVDVGGGVGHVSISLLRHHPELHACVVELPELVPLAERHAAAQPPEIRERLSFVGGDMLVEVPEGDAYLLSGIIHDWDDASCVRVLENCRARLSSDGRIVCVDSVLPPLGDTGGAAAKLLDVNMLVHVPGKERTEAQWAALFEAARLELVSITELERGSASVLETRAR